MICYLKNARASELKGVALLRLDFNTEDSWRLEAALPTIKFLASRARAVVIISHRGRPAVRLVGGVPQGADVRKFTLAKDAKVLQKFLKQQVKFVPHFRFNEILEEINSAEKGSVFLLENARFLPGEEINDKETAAEFAALGDYYVNDAFAVSHRSNASLVAITNFMPSYAGLLMEKEIRSLSGVMRKAKKPFVLIAGGAKAHDKLGVFKMFRKKADIFLLGGAPANTILALEGVKTGDSLRDKDPKDIAALKPFMRDKKVFFPVDWKKSGGKILDIGPATASTYAFVVSKARTILWAGPLGFIEKRGFENGSLEVARAVARNRKAYSVTGGGETVMFLKKHKLDKGFSFISTGGGALLEYLSGTKLPGIAALEKRGRAK